MLFGISIKIELMLAYILAQHSWIIIIQMARGLKLFKLQHF